MTVPTNLPPDYEMSTEEILRQNIRQLKTYRRVSDAQIAERVGYSSRQQVADRIGGRTPFSAEDIDRISRALFIDRLALQKPLDEMMSWVLTNQPTTPLDGSRRVVVEPKQAKAPPKRTPAKRTASK
ncbi:MAG: helix-turn-helix transcriptional regulator [Jiangellaceae bacterium]